MPVTAAMTLEARGLACVRVDRAIFWDLDFRVEPAGALVLRGPNGSGKSSLLRILAGLLRQAEGAVLWKGVSIDEDPDVYREALRYVGHLDAVKPAFTVAENLAFWAALHGGSADEGAALGRFGIAGLAGVPARFLSAGQRRRLALARLCTAPAALWLLDEPTVSLDDQAVAALVEVIAEHRRRGGMLVLATHLDLGVPDTETIMLGEDAPASGARGA